MIAHDEATTARALSVLRSHLGVAHGVLDGLWQESKFQGDFLLGRQHFSISVARDDDAPQALCMLEATHLSERPIVAMYLAGGPRVDPCLEAVQHRLR